MILKGKGDARHHHKVLLILQLMIESIQLGSSTTFLLPKDVKMSGDISGIAIMLTLDISFQKRIIENVAKMVLQRGW